MTDLNKFEVTGLLHFHKGLLLSHVAECVFQILFCVKEKDRYIDTKSYDKESIVLLLHKNTVLFYPNYRFVEKKVIKRMHQGNQGEIIEISSYAGKVHLGKLF